MEQGGEETTGTEEVDSFVTDFALTDSSQCIDFFCINFFYDAVIDGDIYFFLQHMTFSSYLQPVFFILFLSRFEMFADTQK